MDKLRHALNLQLFADDPDPTPDTDPQDPQPKTFTQEDIDRVVADRIARERKKYGDYDELKTKLSEYEQAQEERNKADMSVAERLEAEKVAALKAADEAKAERDKALTTANQRLIKAEFKALARELNIRADAVDDALKLTDLTGVSVDEDGNVAGIEDVVKALIESKPYLVEQAKPQAKVIGSPTAPGEQSDKTKEQILAEFAIKVKANPTPQKIAEYTKLKRELELN